MSVIGDATKQRLQSMAAAAAILLLGAPAAAGSPAIHMSVCGDKLKYGALSPLVSSYILGTRYPRATQAWADPTTSPQAAAKLIKQFKATYESVSDDTILLAYEAVRQGATGSIYHEDMTAFADGDYADFIGRLAHRPDLCPTDADPAGGTRPKGRFQFNVHRGLYNNAFGILPNSLGAVVNAYVAGFRSVEFDVLETRDHANVVIHDLVTNRLTADYMGKAEFVDQTNASAMTGKNAYVLNPFAPQPAYECPRPEACGVLNIMESKRFLTFVRTHMPEMTVYVDARNYAPASMFKVFHDAPDLGRNAVVKIYPFTLYDGAAGLIREYASRRGVTEPAAAAELEKLRPKVLIAIGSAAGQVTEWSMVRNAPALSFADFDANHRKALPFSRVSTSELNVINSQRIFNDQDLMEIERMSWTIFNWAMSFAPISDIHVLQLALLPSLEVIQKSGPDLPTFNAMPLAQRRQSAIADNVVALYKGVLNGSIPAQAPLPSGGSVPLKSLLQNSVLGFSDRYPDFQVRDREGDIANYYYTMDGVVVRKDADYNAQLMRSTRAAYDFVEGYRRVKGLEVGYATTDLPIDLRMTFLKSGDHDVIVRPNGLIKHGYAEPSVWSARLDGAARAKNPAAYDELLKELKAQQGKRVQLQQELIAAEAVLKGRRSSSTRICRIVWIRRLRPYRS